MFAHSENPHGHFHPLKDHLRAVADRAGSFSDGLEWCQDVQLAGLLHDLGKYGDLFQRRLRGQEQGLDHWSAGAWVALADYHSSIAALCVQGHHIGLQSGAHSGLKALDPEALERNHPLRLRLSGDQADLKRRWQDDGGAVQANPQRHRAITGAGPMLETRLAFSALVDADFLDTEAHFQADASGKRHRKSGPALKPQKALQAVLEHLSRLAAVTQASTAVRQVRQTLLQEALASAEAMPGLFTLTAPTGSGKTLAMLAFALMHAARHGLRRVVLAVPYLSILEQTAKTYRQLLEPLFGPDYILEHHSLAGLDADSEVDLEKERLRRLHSENWDAPLVLTTNVQLLESLFSNRPSACRKLHRLTHSVILFDEAQTLPLKLALPTLATLSQLAHRAEVSVVFATATQPAYEALQTEVRQAGGLDWSPKEIVPSTQALFGQSHRVDPVWELRHGAWDRGRLRREAEEQPQSLFIFNLKRHALALTEALEGTSGLFHLSTNLCPAHRRVVLEQVRQRLVQGQPCRLVATQCVEAGVDLDFPVVYRALGPLEALAQAAGRCNREGRNKAGSLRVFEPVDVGYPDDAYHQASAITRSLLVERDWVLDLDAPSVYRDYYKRLFDLAQPGARSSDLQNAIQAGDFVETTKLYRLIRQDAINVLVPFPGQAQEYQSLVEEEEASGIHAAWMRRAQGLAVGCFRPGSGQPAWAVLKPARLRFKGLESDEWYLLNESVSGWAYDEAVGLSLPAREAMPVMIA